MSKSIVVVVPFKNESLCLKDTLKNLAETTTKERSGGWQVSVVGVDHNSSDESAEIFRESCITGGLEPVEIVRLENGEVVSARRTGFEAALDLFPDSNFIVSLDADTQPANGWFDTVIGSLCAGHAAVSFVGTFPTKFWNSAPHLKRAYSSEVGDIFFDYDTESSIGAIEGRFNKEIFWKLGRALVDQFFAITPTAYRSCGGHKVVTSSDGSELLHEGGRLTYEVLKRGYAISTPVLPRYETSPRRLLGEATKLFSGESYTGNMKAHRNQDDDFSAVSELEINSCNLNFATLRSYVVRNYILFQVLCQPPRTLSLRAWLPESLVQSLSVKTHRLFEACHSGVGSIEALDELDKEYGLIVEREWKDRRIK